MSSRVRLAILGAGLIGRRHIEHVLAEPDAELVAVVDPAPAAIQVAEASRALWKPKLGDLLKSDRPDGLIIATPNQLHAENGLEAIAAGIPLLVEKPITDAVASATALVEAAERAGVPILVGHHRRHNPLIRKAKEIIDSGRIGRVLTAHGSFWLMKPDDYFEVSWRRQAGGGPVFLNLIHDVDLFRHLIGEVVSVQAAEGNPVRGHAVEDTAVILLRFATGAFATLNVSDCVVAPWSWETTAGENPAYPRQDEFCYQIGGTHGSLTIPDLKLWSHPAQRSWWEPLNEERAIYAPDDPLKLQLRNFCAVIRGDAEPVVGGQDGLATLKVITAIKEAARTGLTISV